VSFESLEEHHERPCRCGQESNGAKNFDDNKNLDHNPNMVRSPKAAAAAKNVHDDEMREDVPGLRERKAAATRAALCDALVTALTNKRLGEITVEELAAAANVSRMTFFNYFPTKEHAAWHMVGRWMFALSARTERSGARGVAAVLEIAEAFAEELARSDTPFMRTLADLTVTADPRADLELTLADRITIAPDLKNHDLEWRSLGRLLTRFVAEARAAGEVEVDGSDFEVAHYLGAVLNGAAIMNRTVPDADNAHFLRRHVRRALGLGFGTAHGWPALPAPKAPARYQTSRRRKT
jgi:AcrR family transcriptional regulator